MIDMYPDVTEDELETAFDIFVALRDRGYRATDIDMTIDGGGEYYVEVSD